MYEQAIAALPAMPFPTFLDGHYSIEPAGLWSSDDGKAYHLDLEHPAWLAFIEAMALSPQEHRDLKARSEITVEDVQAWNDETLLHRLQFGDCEEFEGLLGDRFYDAVERAERD